MFIDQEKEKMKITKIKILKNKVSIFFNKERLDIDKEIYPNFYLYEGKEVSSKEYKEIKEYNNVSKYLSYALRIRSKAIYSEYTIREKLYNKGANKKEVDKVIKSMKAYDLIDDKAFATDLVEYYSSLNYGKEKIIKKLLDKGIFEENISKISFPINIEKRKANNLLPKLEKKYEKYNYSLKKKHIYDAYISYGFSNDIASEMINKIKPANIKEENNKLEKDFIKLNNKYKSRYQKKEMKQKIISTLLSKGYKLKDIISILERKHY